MVCGMATSIRTVPFGEGGSPLGGAPESWRSADSNLATLASNVSSLLDFSVSDA